MTDVEREQLREIILKQIGKTKEKIVSMEATVQPIGPENAIGRVSRMDAINNKSVAEAALRQARIKLRSLENSLKSINEPSYGNCTRCGKEIEIKRLMLMPESNSCVRCS
jgi:DnaK suppressor protein